MTFLNDAINAALREHNVPQVGTSGSSSLADAVRSLFAPKAHQAGLSAEDIYAEIDAIQELLDRFQHGGFEMSSAPGSAPAKMSPSIRLTLTLR